MSGNITLHYVNMTISQPCRYWWHSDDHVNYILGMWFHAIQHLTTFIPSTVCSKMKVSKIIAHKSKKYLSSKLLNEILWSVNFFLSPCVPFWFPEFLTFMMVCHPNVLFQNNVHFLWTQIHSLFFQNLVFLHYYKIIFDSIYNAYNC